MSRTVVAAAVFSALASAALAAAPEPARPVDPAAYVGRWYEVARLHNKLQLDCEAPTMDFAPTGQGRFTLTQTCRKGSPSGAVSAHRGAARITDPTTNAKIRVGFFGGLVQKDYWIVDHAPDSHWALLATPDGTFMWLLARNPTLPERAEVLARAKLMGFDLSRIEYAKQPPA